ncbi:potassium transporter [Coprinopsis sp. MPI-PUGE-AT-0042]|nr:potassium transporter [Coprinopsis sp. MPI-PUGE-AT-0042]
MWTLMAAIGARCLRDVENGPLFDSVSSGNCQVPDVIIAHPQPLLFPSLPPTISTVPVPDMADQPSENQPNDDRSLWNRFTKHLNFYRVHLLGFTFTPLVFSVIFYLSNGRNKISYVDSLFNCISAMAVCGLATVDLSSLTPFQQVLLFIQMCIGSPIVVSWLIVYSRKRYIERHCSHLFANYLHEQEELKRNSPTVWQRFAQTLRPEEHHDSINATNVEQGEESLGSPKEKSFKEKQPKDKVAKERPKDNRLRTDMIRRVSQVNLRPVNPSGAITDNHDIQVIPPSVPNSAYATPTTPLSRQTTPASTASEDHISALKAHVAEDPFPRTVTFDVNNPKPLRQRPTISKLDHDIEEHPREPYMPRVPTHASFPRTQTRQTFQSHLTGVSYQSRKNQGFGGFPMPFAIIKALFHRLFPHLGKTLRRTVTHPATVSLTRVPTGQSGNRPASYIRENATIKVGRNSEFKDLSPEDHWNMGIKEYEALSILLWVVGVYHIIVQLVSFTVVAPYMSTPRWSEDLEPPQLVRPINSVWFSAFQVVSAYTNTGTSLVDQSMLPFQSAYVMIMFMIFLILAGNTCFPIFLRFVLWMIKKVYPRESTRYQVLDFLLDHPRRCYIYLFPSHQTWFLLTIVIGLTMTDFIFYIILDIGNEALSMIPTGVRILDGFMQSIAVRAAGFAIVPLASLAPAVKVCYVVMMYISVYPIAMSVRSTNVYEKNSLGVYEEEDELDEENFDDKGGRVEVWGRYLALHARQQLAFDMWWIVLGLFLVCIIESGNLNNPEKYGWFNVFNILFELVSAYGIVGLSLGVPHANFSFSGDFKTLSKLIVCVVMIRGRHRGLPVAIDRAILFPKEFKLDRTTTLDHTELVQSPDTMSQTEGRSRSMDHHHLPQQHLPPPILSQPSDDSERIRFETGAPPRPRRASHADHLSMLSDRSTRARSENSRSPPS